MTTLIACRNMWHTASLRMKADLTAAGAELLDNVVVTDEGAALASFVTTPRWMFTGRNNAFWHVFPPAGVPDETISSLARFGARIGAKQDLLAQRPAQPLLIDLDAVRIEHRMVVPELIGRTIFPWWARFVLLVGHCGRLARRIALYFFFVSLVLTVLVAVPLSAILRILLYPFIRSPLQAYVDKLKAPSGSETPQPTNS